MRYVPEVRAVLALVVTHRLTLFQAPKHARSRRDGVDAERAFLPGCYLVRHDLEDRPLAFREARGEG